MSQTQSCFLSISQQLFLSEASVVGGLCSTARWLCIVIKTVYVLVQI